MAAPPLDAARARYLRRPERIVFPEEAEVPETQLHLELRTLLYHLMQDYVGKLATVSSDQFVYWAADDPSQCLAPDVAVRRGASNELIRTWKTWERGAPEVAVEIVSDSDASDAAWEDKLNRYRRLGVMELVRFDPEARGVPLRVWDRVDDDLTERVVDSGTAPSVILPLTWVVAPADGIPRALRMTSGDASAPLVPTRLEARRAEEQARRTEEQARRTEEQARRAAERRIAELEAELAKKSE